MNCTICGKDWGCTNEDAEKHAGECEPKNELAEGQIITLAMKAIVESGRLVQLFSGGDRNLDYCVHGTKLRWSCEDCEDVVDPYRWSRVSDAAYAEMRAEEEE